MFVGDVAEEAVGVGEALRAGALADADDAVLLRVQHPALFPHRLRIRDRRTEKTRPLQTTCPIKQNQKKKKEGK